MTAPGQGCAGVADGFGIYSFGELNVATVSPTRRGAIVNWLVVIARCPVFAWTTDEDIERQWWECTGSRKDHECVAITIARKSLSDIDASRVRESGNG